MRALALWLPLLASGLAAQTVRTIVSNGPTTNRYDVVILGDGYRATEQARFDSDCLTFSAALFQKEPYRTFGRYFNVHTVFRPSNESGADQPDVNPPIVRDTVYDATYNYGGTDRCLYIRNTGLALADAALAPANEGRVLVMVNDSRYGGCASTFAVSYNGSSMNEVQIHEMGHSVGGLADEYWYTGWNYTGGEVGEPNATISSLGNKWSHWLGSNGIGAFQGCRYNETGIYRPFDNCLMRSLGRPLCSVCSEALVLRAHQSASAIDQPQPAATSLALPRPATQAFSFTNIAPATSNVTITWKLDGATVATGVTSHTLDSQLLGLGRHVLRLELLDRTAFVRRDPSSRLLQVREWTVDVTGAGADLTILDVSTTSPVFAAGMDIRVDATVRNVGTLAAPACVIGWYLSTDQTFGSEDVFLGHTPLASLAANTSLPVTRLAVRVPAYVLPGNYYLGAVADDLFAVGEIDETNNARAVSVRATAPACGPVLELRDAMLFPKDAATLRMSSALPFTQPTITSRCTPGDRYLLLWGCSGTNPGTPIFGYTLPLNVDACTELSLSWRGPFVSFIGVLDGNGIGRPNFSLLGVPYVGDLDTNLAALVFANDLRVLGVSNAVGVAIRQ